MTFALCVCVALLLCWALEPVARDAWLEWQLRKTEAAELRKYLASVKREAERAFAEQDGIREVEFRQEQAREERIMQGEDFEREGQ